MNLKKRFILVVILLVNIVTVKGQSSNVNADDFFTKVEQYYEKQNAYKIDLNYTMYKGIDNAKQTESYGGEAIKDKDFYKYSILGNDVCIFGTERLIFDHKEKEITYSKIDESKKMSPVDFTGYKKFFDKKIIRQEGRYVICELTSTRANYENPYRKIVLYADKSSYALMKQELIFEKMIPFKDDETGEARLHQGMLVITLKEEPTKNMVQPKLSDFIQKAQNNKIRLNKKYSIYKLINQEK